MNSQPLDVVLRDHVAALHQGLTVHLGIVARHPEDLPAVEAALHFPGGVVESHGFLYRTDDDSFTVWGEPAPHRYDALHVTVNFPIAEGADPRQGTYRRTPARLGKIRRWAEPHIDPVRAGLVANVPGGAFRLADYVVVTDLRDHSADAVTIGRWA